MSISISRAILHILDTSVGVPVISENLMSLSEETREYIEKHLSKCLNDADLKKTNFINEDVTFYKLINEYKTGQEFKNLSVTIANLFYNLMCENPDISTCDMLFVDCNINNKDYFVILKLNYKKGHIHYTKNEDGVKNTILDQPYSLPTVTQKIQECIFIDTGNFEVYVKEKRCQVYNEICYYISKHILGCKEEKPDKEKVKIITETTDKLIKEFYDDDLMMKTKVKNIIRENVEESLNIDIEKLSEAVFKDENVKKAYNEELKMKGIKDAEVKINLNYANKIKSKQKIVTDEGVELNIPYEMLNNKDKVEFITDVDGTISILLKNIDSII